MRRGRPRIIVGELLNASRKPVASALATPETLAGRDDFCALYLEACRGGLPGVS